jgi:hypothetical protein
MHSPSLLAATRRFEDRGGRSWAVRYAPPSDRHGAHGGYVFTADGSPEVRLFQCAPGACPTRLAMMHLADLRQLLLLARWML